MVEDKRGDVWICTEGGGLNCLERETGRFTHYLMDAKSAHGPFYNLKCITYDAANDQLYIGTHKQGGLCFDIPSKRVAFHSKAFGNTWIKVTFRDEKIYLLTGEGMFVKEGKGNFQKLFPQIPEANTEGSNFLIDSQNYLWITHWRRIVRINMNNPQEKYIYQYGEKDWETIMCRAWRKVTMVPFISVPPEAASIGSTEKRAIYSLHRY